MAPHPVRLLPFLVFSLSLQGQGYTFTTFAGAAPQAGGTDGTGTAARFVTPTAVAADAIGNIYVADGLGYNVRKITPAGVVTTLAGTSGVTGALDGAGPAARFGQIYGIVVDPAGNIVLSDYDNHTIRRITPAGVVSTLAGTAGSPGSTDGVVAAARFRNPVGLVYDRAGNLFVADRGNAVLRKITPDGLVTTVAGSAGVSGTTDGAGSAARFLALTNLAADGSDNLYLLDASGCTVRKITPDGTVSTFAGSAGRAGSANGVGSAARFNQPNGIAIDAMGDLFIADSGNETLRKVSPDGTVTLFAGLTALFGNADGAATAAHFYLPYGLTIDRAGNIYLADAGNRSIRKITAAGDVSTLAGAGGTFGSNDGKGTAARLAAPANLTRDSAGNIFVTDPINTTVRKITPAGVVTTFAGAVNSAGTNDSVGSAVSFGFPYGIAANSNDTLYVCDTVFDIIREITPAANVTTIAGQPLLVGSTDGQGAAAHFDEPRSLAIDRDGNVFIADTTNQTIRKLEPDGTVTTYAGIAGRSGSTDGVGVVARFLNPDGLAVDDAGNVFVCDYGNNTIRKISPDRTVSTIAGLAGVHGSADGVGSAARFYGPEGVAVDRGGNLFVTDSFNELIRKITPDGRVSTIAGAVTTSGFSDVADGTGTAARFSEPDGILVDPAGVLYIADSINGRIVRGVLDAPPVITVQPQSLVLTPGAGLTLSVEATGGGLLYQWRLDGSAIPGATTNAFAIARALDATTGNYTVTIANSAGSLVSSPASISLSNTTDRGHITNLAIRSLAGTGAETLVVGVAIGGAGTAGSKPILIRAVGPTLGAFGVADALSDPQLELYSDANKLTANDDWAGNASVASAGAQVGAFPLNSPASKDAALFQPALAPGVYSVQVTGHGTATGIALAEIYDATASGTYGLATPRLINVSARTQVGVGSNVLVAGFVIAGQTAKTVLIRAVGPTLAAFGVAGALLDPQLEIFSDSGRISANDNWGGDPALAATFSNVGAFALSTSSADAALLLTLAPGAYTAQVSGVGDTTGVALVEVYEVP